jgi:AcrR family transcriptional regulator
VVARDQRERIVHAVTVTVADFGYAQTTVSDICAAARVGRKTFYQQFEDKESAFLAAYEESLTRLTESSRTAAHRYNDLPLQVAGWLTAFAELITAEPELGAICFIEVVSAGPRARRRRDEALQALAAGLLAGARRHAPAGVDIPPLAADLVVGGIGEIVNARVLKGEAAALLDDVPDMVYCALVPFCGHTEAGAHADRARAWRADPAIAGAPFAGWLTGRDAGAESGP